MSLVQDLEKYVNVTNEFFQDSESIQQAKESTIDDYAFEIHGLKAPSPIKVLTKPNKSEEKTAGILEFVWHNKLTLLYGGILVLVYVVFIKNTSETLEQINNGGGQYKSLENTRILFWTSIVFLLFIIGLVVFYYLKYRSLIQNKNKKNIERYNNALANYESSRNNYVNQIRDYDSRLSEYKRKLSLIEKEKNENDIQIEKAFKDKYANVTIIEVDQKYMPYANRLLEIAKQGKAETLADAYRVLDEELFREEMLNQQRQATEYARQQAMEERIRRKQEEAYYRQQAAKEAERRQERARNESNYASAAEDYYKNPSAYNAKRKAEAESKLYR